MRMFLGNMAQTSTTQWSETTALSERATCTEPHAARPRRGGTRGVGSVRVSRSSARATCRALSWPSPRTGVAAVGHSPHAGHLSEDARHGVPCRSSSPMTWWSPTTSPPLPVASPASLEVSDKRTRGFFVGREQERIFRQKDRRNKRKFT